MTIKNSLDDVLDISELTVRTQPNPYYIPPRPFEVNTALKHVKMEPKHLDIISDVINLESGGEYTSQANDFIEAEMWANGLPVSKSSDGFFINNVPAGVHKTKEELKKAAIKLRTTYHNNVRSFLQQLDQEFGFRKIPGRSPMARAINLIQLLVKQKGDNFNQQGMNVNDLVNQIKEAVGRANNIDPMASSLMGYDKKEEEGGNGGGFGGGDDEFEMKKMEIARDMMTGKETIERIARNLSNLSRLQISAAKKREADPAGRMRRMRFIQDFSEMPKMPTLEWAYPEFYRDYRIVTNHALVYETVRETDHKQLLYMIVDCSGSMNGQRTWIAGGCIMRGLMGVMKEDAELYLSFFDTNLRQEMVARTPDQAKEVMQTVLSKNHSGGGTQITKCVKLALERIRAIKKENKLIKPELMIVTDGEDDTSRLDESQFGDVKFHAICVMTKLDHLVRLAFKLGGVGLMLGTSDSE